MQMTAEHAAALKRFDFPVQLQDVQTTNGQRVSGAKVIVRTDIDMPLKVVTDRYSLFTHAQAVEQAQKFIDYFGEHTHKDFIEKNGARFTREYTFKNQVAHVVGRDLKVGDVVHFRLAISNSYGLGTSIALRIAAMVLRCLNGMTGLGGALELKFRHTGDLEAVEFPDPQAVIESFSKSAIEWNNWAARDLTTDTRDFVLRNALQMLVVSKRSVKEFSHLLEPNIDGLNLWSYYNNFTEVLTHKLNRIQHSSKIVRMDRLNAIFKSALRGTEVAENPMIDVAPKEETN